MKKNKSIAYSPKSAWEIYSSKNDKKAMLSLAQDYIDFLSTCKTERETVDYVLNKLKEHGYEENLNDISVVRPFRNKTIFIARRGKKDLSKGIHLISAHTDTPRLDFKQRPFIEQAGVAQAKTHYYGGIRKYQWLARPLALHGVVIKADGTKVNIVLGEDNNEPVFTIADLLPHLAQKQVSQSITDAFEAEKLNIILGHSPKIQTEDKENKKENKSANKDKEPIKSLLLDLIYEKYELSEEDFISAELQAVPAGNARFVGLDKSIVGGYGQDDRICVFTALQAFLAVEKPEHCIGLIFWDKEEIGSEGATGASSRFLQYCIEDCRKAWQSEASLGDIMLATKALSADVQAALDPDWQELHEKQNAAQLGYGVCFSKFTGSRGKVGASDADAELVAYMRGILNKQEIPWQMAECGKVDLGGGGTVALFLAAYGMQVIDCGPPVLSMHSPFELSSVVDIWSAVQAYTEFLKN